MVNCPPITLVGETSVSGSIQAMDCHINAAVETGYNRLFGVGGAFGYALTSVLVIYVALLAIGFLTGRTRLTLTMMSPRLVTLVLVLTFVTFWPAYHTIFYGLFMDGPDEVAAALLGQKGSAVLNFAQGLDALFVRFADIAKALENNPNAQTGAVAGAALAGAKPMPVTLFWLSGLLLLGSTLGVLILTRMVLYLLLILGPVFIVFGLFSQTRGLFNGWLRTSLVFALAPLLTVLGGTAALLLFLPLINSIGDNPQEAVQAVQPMVILFLGSMIYCAFLFTLMWVSASLVRDWQAAVRDKPATGLPSSAALPVYAAPPGTAALVAASLGGNSRINDAYERTEPLVTAVTRNTTVTNSGGNRAESLGLYDPEARRPAGSADRFSRVQGLGQRFRPGGSPALRQVTSTQRPAGDKR
jgi:type IV secretion system protein VirB6